MSEGLQAEAERFARRLTDLIQGCISGAPAFEVVDAKTAQQLRIGPRPFRPDAAGFSLIQLPRSCDSGRAPLTLKIEFRVSLDDAEEHLAVQHSTYGLWVQPDPKRNRRPVFRVEYDREAYNKPPSHVHLHAESLEFGWIYGTAGVALPRLSELHFPVGGRRFRPTVEEFLRFLNGEKIYVDWQDGWEEIVQKSFAVWEQVQARATVREHAEAAVQQLRSMGYQIIPPTI